MVNLRPVEFHARYLDCYEAALMGIFWYMGLTDATPLMGTNTYFVLNSDESGLTIRPRVNYITDEWKLIHNLTLQWLPVLDEIDLCNRIKNFLDRGIPVCLPVDVYFLHYTPHYHLHHHYHFIDVFGYNEDHYYVTSPYYEFAGWLGAELIHASVFSSAIKTKCVIHVPELKFRTLSPEWVQALVEENCLNMLGLRVPDVLNGVNAHHLGLAGIRTFSALLQELIVSRSEVLSVNGYDLSTQIMTVGYSRYWFHRLVQDYRKYLIADSLALELQQQFASVTDLWRVIGLRFAAGLYTNSREQLDRALPKLEQVYHHEYRIFNLLLGGLLKYENGEL